MHDFLRSVGIPKRDLLGSVTQGGSGMMEGRGRCRRMVRRLLGRLDDNDEGHAFERGYLGSC